MKVLPLNSNYFIYSVPNHQTIKSILLKQFDEMPDNGINIKTDKITKFDWNLDSSYERSYYETMRDVLGPFLEKMAIELLCTKWDVHNLWFQQYMNLDQHNWHTHAGANWTNVYFVELPNSLQITELFDLNNCNTMQLADVKEGDILTFPGYYLHRSPINKFLERKTIVSFNTSFYGQDSEMVQDLIYRKCLDKSLNE